MKKEYTKKRKTSEFRITGTLHKYKKGFGFIEVAEESEKFFSTYEPQDVFVSARDINGAMDGDVVEAVILPQYFWKGSRPEAQISKVLTRAVKEVVGTFQKSKRFGFVVPEGKLCHEDVFVAKKGFGGAETGDKVVCTITEYPSDDTKAEGKITEIIARRGEPGADIKMLIRAYGYTKKFPRSVQLQAEKAAAEGPVWKADERRDLREKAIFTIDGRDSKDFDDAVSVDILENGNYMLGVHIADVSHYVTEDSPLDKEALKRGTSIYLIDQVVPMLPEALSNDICSLRPNEDRLTLSVNMEINREGEVVDYEIYESVIKSKYRLVYDDVSDVIEGKSEFLRSKYDAIYADIMNMAELAAILRKKREERGSLDFEFDEASIKLDKQGVPVSVDIAERRVANRLIEEFMLTANETVAKHFFFLQVPFVYRVHEKPATEKIEELKTFMRGFGINMSINPDNVRPKLLADILSDIHGKTYENVVSTVMLRAMRKAVYDTECLGHFGLALSYYCHFTSPIRRYPDLIIHRIIKETIKAFPPEKRIKTINEKAKNAAELSSIAERKAIDLERDVEKLKKAEYMSYHIGEIYDGVISGITNYGIFVQLENTIEGMVRLEYLMDDFYDYEPQKYRVIGRGSGNIYALGQEVRIKVRNADPETREIDFSMLPKRSKINND